MIKSFGEQARWGSVYNVMLWTEYLCSLTPNSYAEALMPNVIILGGGIFEK